MTSRPWSRAGCIVPAVWLLGAAAPVDTSPLFAALLNAPSTASAEMVEAKLQAVWHDQATPSVQLLIDQASEKIMTGHAKDALADCEAAVVLQPDLADLWRRRAEARMALGDEAGATADLAQALSREPRLLPALVDLSQLAEAQHNYPQALKAWQKVLELDPKTAKGQARLDRLRRRVNGEPI
jgi:tetratricopeptide (TPR) repeat protein